MNREFSGASRPTGKTSIFAVFLGSLAFLVVLIAVSAVDTWVHYTGQLANAEPGADPASIAAGARFAFAHFVFFGLIYYAIHLLVALVASRVVPAMTARHCLAVSAITGLATMGGFVAFRFLLASRFITAATSWWTVLNVIALCVAGFTVLTTILVTRRSANKLGAT